MECHEMNIGRCTQAELHPFWFDGTRFTPSSQIQDPIVLYCILLYECSYSYMKH